MKDRKNLAKNDHKEDLPTNDSKAGNCHQQNYRQQDTNPWFFSKKSQ